MDTPVKLLLLEDSPTDAALIQKLLQRSGIRFNSKVASDEEEFLTALEENDFDAVLADNALPQYSSLEALKLLKQKNPFIAFILVTGTVSEEFAVNILQLGRSEERRVGKECRSRMWPHHAKEKENATVG